MPFCHITKSRERNGGATPRRTHENGGSGTDLARLPIVTVRITVREAHLDRRVVVEGRLCADAVADLENTVGDDPRNVVLDLANLRSADAAGVAALRRLRAAGVALQGAGLHLAWQIETEP